MTARTVTTQAAGLLVRAADDLGPCGARRDRGVIGLAGGTKENGVAELLAPSEGQHTAGSGSARGGLVPPVDMAMVGIVPGLMPLLVGSVSCKVRYQRIAEGDDRA